MFLLFPMSYFLNPKFSRAIILSWKMPIRVSGEETVVIQVKFRGKGRLLSKHQLAV